MAHVLDLPTLQGFLRRAASIAHVWGTHDCCLMIADWAMLARNIPDPAAALRGHYSTEAELTALIAPKSWQDVLTEIADGIGLARTTTPGDGDIAIVTVNETTELSGIMVDGAWAFLTTRGIAWARVSRPIVRAWSMFDA